MTYDEAAVDNFYLDRSVSLCINKMTMLMVMPVILAGKISADIPVKIHAIHCLSLLVN